MTELVSVTDTECALLVSLGRWTDGSGPLYQRLAGALRDAVERGIPPGAALPPERRLASLLAVSRTTVVAAYRTLRREGWLESRQGSGTRVAAAVRAGRPAVPFAFASTATFRSLIDRDTAAIDLAAAGLGADGIITPELLARASAELGTLARSVGYMPHGLPSLREAIARHLSESGLPTDEQQILVTNGAQQAITLLAQLLAGRGASVVVENPTYAGALDAFAAAGARLLGIRVQEEPGPARPLRQLLRGERPQLLYLMPTFQNPTGAVSTTERRRQLAVLAAEQEVLLVEDNTLAPLAVRPAPAPPPPVAALDPHGNVVTIGSLSKSVWAGLRVGWIRAHPRLIGRLVMAKTAADLGSSLPSQALARAVLDDFARISSIRAGQLRDCLELAASLLRERLPDWQFVRPKGGQSLWLRLPGGDAESFAQVALRHGVIIVPGSQLSPDGSFGDHIRLQFLQSHQLIDQGIARLARAWQDHATAGARNLGVIV
jgi:DNA-binding transcriptional MocR family regulator